jgi:outer membrane protein assembly factor BamE (lipoprotein component of BamABCDE complex)
MKTSRNFAFIVMVACAVLLAGCATPESRISHSPDAFARLNPDQQALVKAGRIAPGFDMEAVRLALGDPDRVIIHTDASGQHEVWHYVTYEDYQGGIIFTGYYHRYWGWGGPFFYGGAPYYQGYPAHVRDRIRVEFDGNNRVANVQQEKP